MNLITFWVRNGGNDGEQWGMVVNGGERWGTMVSDGEQWGMVAKDNDGEDLELVETGFLFTLVLVQVLVNQLKVVAPAIENSISELSEEVNSISTNLLQVTNYHGRSTSLVRQSTGRTMSLEWMLNGCTKVPHTDALKCLK
ncbi:hypothetical protein CTI12_AA153110 [Artemisia annua]|uniref:Uncharacterized protein n=1 Tax=Artemisia annua TaxID=35608 RepID=A0A2U1PH66_ARTAN|nr:hypothetical protein CTI12_AA153110 [Artemisia annua]